MDLTQKLQIYSLKRNISQHQLKAQLYIYTVYTAKDEMIVALLSTVHNTELYHVFKTIKMENRWLKSLKRVILW